MLNNYKAFTNNSKKFLSTTAMALILSVTSNIAKAATELTDSASYGSTNNWAGFVESDDGVTTNVTFTTSEEEYFHIGADDTPSLVNNAIDSATLNVTLTNGGGALTTSGIIFEDDIDTNSDNTINFF